jgi:predicted nucleotidyltransferase component of viral defense system
VDVLIDRRELLEKARERGLPLAMIEKDYALGWLLLGLSGAKGLVFKGGTALSKVYFPRTWRLSEDLDFVFMDMFICQMACDPHSYKQRRGLLPASAVSLICSSYREEQ